MHQDDLFIRVHVELDDIAFAVTVQELITCKETERNRDFNSKIFLNIIFKTADIITLMTTLKHAHCPQLSNN